MVIHEVQLRGATVIGPAGGAPVLFSRKDPDFLNAVLREVRTPAGRSALKATTVSTGTSAAPALLYQPVQRVMYVALLEAFCVVPGHPRLDPSKIDSAGVVIRRVPVDKTRKPNFQSRIMEGWMQDGKGSVGWRALNVNDQDLDPDPTRRPLLHTGQAYLDKVLHDKVSGAARFEAVSPAFAAPPDVCADAQRTLIYALLPLSSSELTAAPPQTVDDNALRQHLPVLIKVGNRIAPLAGKSVTSDYASEDYLRTHLSATDQNKFKSFLMLLNTMAVEFGIFDDDAKPESKNLLARLNELSVTFAGPPKRTKALGQFLHDAKKVLIDGDPTATTSLLMPTSWPKITVQQQETILTAIRQVVLKRLPDMSQQRSRFQNPARIYQARAFIRVKHDGACPPKIVWSDPSLYFNIAPWYDGPGIPTPPVVLPDLTDRNALKKLKPNVSFGVPAGLFNAMQGASLDGLMKGNKGGGGALNLDWICGFNIPIITICAFFVLSIFLSLLNIVFFWLPFVKICIPIPKGTLNSD